MIFFNAVGVEDSWATPAYCKFQQLQEEFEGNDQVVERKISMIDLSRGRFITMNIFKISIRIKKNEWRWNPAFACTTERVAIYRLIKFQLLTCLERKQRFSIYNIFICKILLLKRDMEIWFADVLKRSNWLEGKSSKRPQLELKVSHDG